MNKKSTLLVIVFCFCFSLLYAQDNAISNAINKNNIQLENAIFNKAKKYRLAIN